MNVDTQTFRDLEIFESESEGPSLFEAFDLTRTEGGRKALRRRMEQPFSDVARIRSAQDALSYIVAHRPLFKALPAIEYTTNRVERYQGDIHELIAYENVVEFGLGVFLLRLNRSYAYNRIVSGVQIAVRFVQALRFFVGQDELASASGELKPVLDEMRQLLARPRLALIPDQGSSGWGPWRTIRMDQVFRLRENGTIRRLLELIYESDALVALADVISSRKLAFPQVDDGALRVHAEELAHPLVESPVANRVELDQRCRLLFLTGPNMAGKTTYLRTFATALYMAHIGMGVPARSFSFAPADCLFSSISHSDDLRGGISYFRAEALRVRTIAEAIAAGRRVVAILDEPFKGTNLKDALDASLAILQRFSARQHCLFMFSSHLIELSQHLDSLTQVECCFFEAEEAGERLRFSYILRPGVSSQRLGMRLLTEEGIFDLLDGDANNE